MLQCAIHDRVVMHGTSQHADNELYALMCMCWLQAEALAPGSFGSKKLWLQHALATNHIPDWCEMISMSPHACKANCALRAELSTTDHLAIPANVQRDCLALHSTATGPCIVSLAAGRCIAILQQNAAHSNRSLCNHMHPTGSCLQLAPGMDWLGQLPS